MKKISFEDAIELLEQGKKVYTKDNRYAAYYCDTLCLYDRITGEMKEYNAKLLSFEDYEIPEEPKPFEITETGLYKSRNGKRIFLYHKGSDVNFFDGVIEGEIIEGIWSADGKESDGNEHHDIIGKWGDDV